MMHVLVSIIRLRDLFSALKIMKEVCPKQVNKPGIWKYFTAAAGATFTFYIPEIPLHSIVLLPTVKKKIFYIKKTGIIICLGPCSAMSIFNISPQSEKSFPLKNVTVE